jgi:hypothetical protein
MISAINCAALGREWHKSGRTETSAIVRSRGLKRTSQSSNTATPLLPALEPYEKAGELGHLMPCRILSGIQTRSIGVGSPRNSTQRQMPLWYWPFTIVNVESVAESGLPMKEQQTFRALSSDIRDVFGRWLTAECGGGVRFVVLEGLMRSGKSMLTRQPFALGTRRSVNIELDQFLRKPVNSETEYIHAFDTHAATAAIREAYRTAPIVVAEGPMAWPVVLPILEEIPFAEVRRAYLKRMSSTNPDLWHDGDFLYEFEPPGIYFQSINRYHAREQPWLLADVVFERVGRDDE